jgi:retron-type reverse transcriptase
MKPNGKKRPLGIPNIRDRVALTEAAIAFEGVFEPDLPDERAAYRNGKKAIEAVKKAQRLLNGDRRLEVWTRICLFLGHPTSGADEITSQKEIGWSHALLVEEG